jgi:c(7)-type cytochrome triheme protein
MKKTLILLSLAVLLTAGVVSAQQQWFELPKQPIPPLYGDFLLDRASSENDMKPVIFSHWRHRVKYTCRVCHFELEFQMKVNETEMTEEDSRDGMFCGTCHDGKTAFGHTKENCNRCHTGKLPSDANLFKEFYKRMPKTKYGNRIDWTEAILRGRIRPVRSIQEDSYESMPFTKTITLDAIWVNAPYAIFPHKAHTAWLDCANCHPHVFNIKKKATDNLTMDSILKGEFCGACHLNVAFPLDDCRKCHPGIKSTQTKGRR